jgi:hypothetical protein
MVTAPELDLLTPHSYHQPRAMADETVSAPAIATFYAFQEKRLGPLSHLLEKADGCFNICYHLLEDRNDIAPACQPKKFFFARVDHYKPPLKVLLLGFTDHSGQSG